tara:strand:- start:125 stop:1201 length:1077 start_codon:yes stop_codon:yes gene_type:complete
LRLFDSDIDATARLTMPVLFLVGVLVVLASFSALGMFLPFVSDSAASAQDSLTTQCLAGLSAGVLVAVAWLHLLDDAQERLDGLCEYPAANAAMLGGYMLMAVIQGLMPCHHHDASKTMPLLPTSSSQPSASQTSEMRSRFYVLEASISFHSVLIGLGLGLATTGWRQQLSLGLALCVHQLLEGLAVSMMGRRSGLSQRAWQLAFLAFALSLPFGAACGLGIRELYAGFDDNVAVRWCSGLLNAIAAGTLTHIGVDMVGSTLDPDAHSHSPPRARSPETVTGIPLDGVEPDPLQASGPTQGTLAALEAMVGAPTKSACGTACMLHGPSMGPSLHGKPVLRLTCVCLGATMMSVLAIWA